MQGNNVKAKNLFKSILIPVPSAVTSELLTSKSQRRQSLNSCVRVQSGGDGRDGIFIDEQVLNDGWWTSVNRTSYIGSGVDGGNCSTKTESVKPSDAGRWYCTLISKPKSGQRRLSDKASFWATRLLDLFACMLQVSLMDSCKETKHFRWAPSTRRASSFHVLLIKDKSNSTFLLKLPKTWWTIYKLHLE